MGPPGFTVTARGELVEPLQILPPCRVLSCGELVEPCKRRGVCPSCGAKRAVKFAEHLFNEVIEDVPHRHTVFTIPKRLRVFFKYDRKLNTIFFKAAWGALAQILGIDERELAAIFTMQTAGDALNFHPHLHGILADGYWKDDVFTRFPEIDIATLNQAFAERVLALLHKQELISDDDVVQILSQDHTGFLSMDE